MQPSFLLLGLVSVRVLCRVSFVGMLLLSVLFTSELRAHHNAGSGQGESQRTLSSMGTDPWQRSRAALVIGGSRSTSEPTLNAATSFSALALLSFRLHPRIFAGVEMPFLMVKEDGIDELKVGYGDTRVGGQFLILPGKEGRVSLSSGLDFSLPTRTVHFSSDPGAQWLISPSVRLTQEIGRFYWFALMHTPYEIRPAGSALDLSTSVAFGVRLTSKLSWVLGPGLDLRLFSVCREVGGGKSLCSDGRASEENREAGSMRWSASTSATYEISKRWSVFAGGQVPLSSRRDIEWAFQLGVEARLGKSVSSRDGRLKD